MTCEHCQNKKGTYSITNTCCCVRFLKSETNNNKRTAIREYWQKKMKPEAYDELMEALKMEKW